MAYLAYRDKTAADAKFSRLLPMIAREAHDERNFVRKGRELGFAEHREAKRSAESGRHYAKRKRFAGRSSRAARWIAADALRELKSGAVQARFATEVGLKQDGIRKQERN